MVPRIEMHNGTSKASVQNGSSQFEDDAIPSTSTACVDAAYILRVAEAVGIYSNTIESAAVDAASNNVMYVLRHVIAESSRFATHSRRTRVVPEDIDAALQALKKAPQYGFQTRDWIPLRLAGSGGRELFVERDTEIELQPIMNAGPLKIPAHDNLRAHWLAIDGEQPAVPENPVPARKEREVQNDMIPPEDGQLQEDASRVLSLMKGTRKGEQVNMKTSTTHTLSLEQQVFFKEIMEAIMGNEDIRRNEALHLLQIDAGLQPLIGRFSISVTEGVKCNLVQHNLAFLIYLMRTVQSLANNPNVSLEKCLHELLPSILTCILSKQVCARPESDNHWALRDFAGRLIAVLCRKYLILDVQSRVTRVLSSVWSNDDATIATLYGSLYALNELGQETIRAVVIPRTPQLYDRLTAATADRSNMGHKVAAEKLTNLVVKILNGYVLQQKPPQLQNLNDFVAMFGGFADAVYKQTFMELQAAPRISATPQRPMKNVQLAPPMAQSSPRIATVPTRVVPRGTAFQPQIAHRVGPMHRTIGGPHIPQQVRYTSNPVPGGPGPVQRGPSTSSSSSRPPSQQK